MVLGNLGTFRECQVLEIGRVNTGILEFIGVHFAIRNGSTVSNPFLVLLYNVEADGAVSGSEACVTSVRSQQVLDRACRLTSDCGFT